MGDANSIVGQLLVTPSLVHGSRSDQPNKPDSPVSKTALKSSFLFFGGPSFSITDQDWGRDLINEEDSIAGQPLVTHIL